VNLPRIMGNNLELQPLTVIFALTVGGQVGGIAGVYLSIPAVAVLRIERLIGEGSRGLQSRETFQPHVQLKA
jgi:predicted PurR-regulated permease PerM